MLVKFFIQYNYNIEPTLIEADVFKLLDNETLVLSTIRNYFQRHYLNNDVVSCYFEAILNDKLLSEYIYTTNNLEIRDIRNKLTPIVNLIEIFKINIDKFPEEDHQIIKDLIKSSDASVNYLTQKNNLK